MIRAGPVALSTLGATFRKGRLAFSEHVDELGRTLFVVNRRQFLYTSTILETASAVSTAFAAPPSKYDLIVKGGRVIDPSRGLNAIRDVGIINGHIAAVEAALNGGAVETINARGKLVVPGLVDIHTHAAASKEGLALCLSDGVTALIDAGTKGADGIDETIAAAKRGPQLCRVLINIGRNGVLMQEGDTMQISRADVGAARELISRNRDMVVGVKARLSQNVTGSNDLEVLRRSQEVASIFNLPVMIHMGQTASPLAKLLPILKSGDIVTHMFAPPPNSIIDNAGQILPEVIDARKRGVFFDLGNGRNGHLRWDIADRVLQAGFLPDTLSTDWTMSSREEQVINFPNVMSKFLMLGLSLDQVVASTTVNASRVFPVFRSRGTLKQGAPADIAVLELREGSFEFVDNYANKRAGRQKLFPSVTVLAGKQAAGPAAVRSRDPRPRHANAGDPSQHRAWGSSCTGQDVRLALSEAPSARTEGALEHSLKRRARSYGGARSFERAKHGPAGHFVAGTSERH